MSDWRKCGPGIWRAEPAQWRVVARIRAGGEIRHLQETFEGGTKAQAAARLAALKDKLRVTYGASSSLTTAETFGDLLRIYLDKRGELSPSHICKCESLRSDLGAVGVAEFGDRFESYLRLKRATPSDRTRRHVSNATINRLVEIARAVFRLGVDLGVTKDNPVSKARFPRLREVPRDRYLNEQERLALFNAIEQTPRIRHIGPIVRFALAVPSRRSELVNLRQDGVDLVNRCIVLRNGTTKNDAGCVKPIPPDQWEYFRNLPPADVCPWVFYREDKGRYYPIGDFKRSWHTALRLSQISGCRFHDLRGTSATDLANNGTDDRTLMFVGGWKTRAMPDRYYRKDSRKLLAAVRFSSCCDSAVIVPRVAAL